MAKPNAAPAAAAPSLTGVPAERARMAIVASKDACIALWEGPYFQVGSRPRSLLRQACARKLTSWQPREDLTDLKRDECKSAHGIHSGSTSYRLLAMQTVLLDGHSRSPDERNLMASQQPNIARMFARPSRPKGSVRTASPTQCPPPPVRPRSRHPRRPTSGSQA
jgi:hypothetical protein